VAGRSGGAWEAVEDGETGFVVDPLDAGAVAGALERLLTDPELRRRMGTAARARAETSFAYDTMNRQVSRTDALNGITRSAYDGDGNRVKDTDALGRVTTHTYDAVNRIVDTTDALGVVTHRDYDTFGNLTAQTAPTDTTQMAVIAAALVEAMSNERSGERVVVGGTANLARFGDSFDQSIKPMLEALEEHVVLLKLLGEATSSDSITVRIGHEGPYEELATTSVVATGYGPGEEAVVSLGIVGPTRMDYPGSMAAVRAVASYVSTILDKA